MGVNAIGGIFFKKFTINSPYLSQYGYIIHKSWLNSSFGITMNVSQNKIAPNMQPAWKVEIQINNTVYTSKR